MESVDEMEDMTMSKGMRQVTVRFEPQVWKKFKLACVEREIQMTDVINELVLEWTANGTTKITDSQAPAPASPVVP